MGKAGNADCLDRARRQPAGRCHRSECAHRADCAGGRRLAGFQSSPRRGVDRFKCTDESSDSSHYDRRRGPRVGCPRAVRELRHRRFLARNPERPAADYRAGATLRRSQSDFLLSSRQSLLLQLAEPLEVALPLAGRLSLGERQSDAEQQMDPVDRRPSDGHRGRRRYGSKVEERR